MVSSQGMGLVWEGMAACEWLAKWVHERIPAMRSRGVGVVKKAEKQNGWAVRRKE